MFAGHVGAGLAIARFEPRINVGAFVAASLLPDLLLWLFVLVGWESVAIPADFADSHQPEFVFPYSHGLVASLVWSAVAAIAAFAFSGRMKIARPRAAALVGAAVFSHWLLDALVHRPELLVVAAGSPKVGLSLWQNMPLALALESTVTVAALGLFLAAAGMSRGRSYGLSALVLLLLALTVAGMTVAPPPPSPMAMASSSLLTLLVVCALATWCGKAPRSDSGVRPG